jgi:hypothetical protein
MWVRVGSSRVSAAQQLGEPGLDLPVQGRAAQHPRPAGVGPPPVQEGRDRLDHLTVQVQTEVVAGGEVDQPALADPDPAAVDLLDDRVKQMVVGEQVLEVGACRQPAREPAPGAAPDQG